MTWLKKGVRLLEETVGEGPPVRRQRSYRVAVRITLSRGDIVRDPCIGYSLDGRDRLDDDGFFHATTRIDRENLFAGLFYAVQGMNVGGRRKVVVAPHLAYGDAGVPDRIPANAKLTVEVEFPIGQNPRGAPDGSGVWSVAPFDPESASPELWTRMHEYSERRHAENDYPGEPPPRQLREDFMRGMPWTTLCAVLPLGYLASVVYLRDGPDGDAVHMSGGVLEEYRGRGIGTCWLRTALARMNEAGVRRLAAKSSLAADHAFFEAVGFRRETSEGGNLLELASIDRDLMARWEADLAERAPGVTLELHPESLDDDGLAEYMAVRARIPDTGEIRETEEDWRQLIDRVTGPDGAHHTIFAREEDGTISGLTDVSWRPDRPAHVIQDFTGVAPDARGRGIGKALKARMIRFLDERHPEATEIGTTNSTDNDPMLSINERMGFVRTIEVVQYGIERDDLASWLERR